MGHAIISFNTIKSLRGSSLDASSTIPVLYLVMHAGVFLTVMRLLMWKKAEWTLFLSH